MRRTLLRFLILIFVLGAMSSVWLFGGRQLSLFADSFRTTEVSAAPIASLVYEGSGTGGRLRIGELALDLTPADARMTPPNIGSTKDGQLALSFAGKVFAFGPPKSENESFTTAPPPGDEASLINRHSLFGWPTFFETNFMTGNSPSWKRHNYYELAWKKPNGAKLKLSWRYEQFFYRQDDWTGGMMTREGVTGLVKIAIEP